MPDEQIHPIGTEAAPADYVFPASAEVLLKMVYASFDGTGAAGSFKPCLRIISDAGTVTGEAVADDTVAAGASVDVTWFPRVGGGGEPSTTNAEWFYVVRSTNFTMQAGTEDTIPWSSLHSSDSSLFSLGTVSHPNDAVNVARQGVLVVSSYLIPTSLGTDFEVGILNGNLGFGVTGENTWTPANMFNRDGLPGGFVKFGPRDISLAVTPQIPGQIFASYHNFDGANRVLTGAQLGGFWWPTSTLIS